MTTMAHAPEQLSGDPAMVRHFASTYQQASEALRQAARDLRALASNDVTISLAIDEVRQKAADVEARTGAVAARYGDAATAWSTYAAALEQAQQRATGAIAMITNNSVEAGYWERRQRRLELEIGLGGADADSVDDLREAVDRVDAFRQDFDYAIALYALAAEDKRRAVIAAIQNLDDAENSAGLTDGVFEAVAGGYQQLYELAQKYLAPLIVKLRAVLDLVKGIVDLLALIVIVLAVFIPALASVATALTVISLTLGALVLLCSLMLFALGRARLGRVVSDGIRFATDAVLTRFGSGLGGGFGAGHGAGHGAGLGGGISAKFSAEFSDDISTGLIGASTTALRTANGAKAINDVIAGYVLGLPEDAARSVGVTALDLRFDAAPSADGPAWGEPDSDAVAVSGIGEAP